MAIMGPASIKDLDGVTPGEIRVFDLLRELLPDTFYVWYDVMVKNRYPDFIILGPNLGVVILEVKDWEAGSIISADSEIFSLRTSGREFTNPLKQARSYMLGLIDILGKHDQLKQKNGKYKGNLSFNYGCGVIFTNINSSEFLKKGFSESIPSDFVIFSDTLNQLKRNCDGEGLCQRLKQMIPMGYRHPDLSQKQMELIRSIISRGNSEPNKVKESDDLGITREKSEHQSYSKFSISKTKIVYAFLIIFLSVILWNVYSDGNSQKTDANVNTPQVENRQSQDIKVSQSPEPNETAESKTDISQPSQKNTSERLASTKNNDVDDSKHTYAVIDKRNAFMDYVAREGIYIKGNISKSGQKIYHLPNQRFYSSTKPEEWFRTEQEAINAGYRKAKDTWIKGNISSNGERIYHMPGQKYYDRTKAEEWFKTENEAIDAGYRKTNI